MQSWRTPQTSPELHVSLELQLDGAQTVPQWFVAACEPSTQVIGCGGPMTSARAFAADRPSTSTMPEQR